jgi:hypothetical protein
MIETQKSRAEFEKQRALAIAAFKDSGKGGVPLVEQEEAGNSGEAGGAQRRWRQKNRERLRVYMRAWRAKQKEKA